VARLIRSKGVGVYFISQNPADIPEVILGQLGNRVQHGLRAFTPKDQKDLAQAAQTYRPNPAFDTAKAIQEVGTGEAVTSFLQDKGVPGIVERTLIRPPSSQLGPIDPGLRSTIVSASPMGAKYNTTIDRDSAYERLQARAGQAAQQAQQRQAAPPSPPDAAPAQPTTYNHARQIGGGAVGATRVQPAPRAPSSRTDSLTEAFAKSFVRQIGTKSGQAVVRGILGGLFGK
jgi:DNA helicase HerA-like ATPase